MPVELWLGEPVTRSQGRCLERNWQTRYRRQQGAGSSHRGRYGRRGQDRHDRWPDLSYGPRWQVKSDLRVPTGSGEVTRIAGWSDGSWYAIRGEELLQLKMEGTAFTLL